MEHEQLPKMNYVIATRQRSVSYMRVQNRKRKKGIILVVLRFIVKHFLEKLGRDEKGTRYRKACENIYEETHGEVERTRKRA